MNVIQLRLFEQPPSSGKEKIGKKKSSGVVISSFSEAIQIAFTVKVDELATRSKMTTKTILEDRCRLRSFLSHEYNPLLGLVGSIQAYLKNLKAAGRSAGYIRRMRGMLNGLVACLPTCQLDFLGVA